MDVFIYFGSVNPGGPVRKEFTDEMKAGEERLKNAKALRLTQTPAERLAVLEDGYDKWVGRWGRLWR